MTSIRLIVLNDGDSEHDPTTHEAGKSSYLLKEYHAVKSIDLRVGEFGMNFYIVNFDNGLCIEIPYHSVLYTVEAPEEK